MCDIFSIRLLQVRRFRINRKMIQLLKQKMQEAPRFADKRGQYVALIWAYSLIMGGCWPNAICCITSASLSPGSPVGADPRTQWPDPQTARRRPAASNCSSTTMAYPSCNPLDPMCRGTRTLPSCPRSLPVCLTHRRRRRACRRVHGRARERVWRGRWPGRERLCAPQAP